MTPEEQRRLLALAESDPELRRALEAERTIDRTLRRDRDAIPPVGPEIRSQVLAMVGALDPSPVMTATVGTGSGRIVALVAAMTLAAGALFLAIPHETSVERGALRDAVRPHPVAPPRTEAPPDLPRIAEVREEKEGAKERDASMESRPTRYTRSSREARTTEHERTATAPVGKIPIDIRPVAEQPDHIQPAAEAPAHAADTAAAPDPAVDSTRIDITIDLDPMKRKAQRP